MKQCKKRKYRDELAAKLALAKIRWQDKPEHTEKRAYYCSKCGAWHLTSRECKTGAIQKGVVK